MREFESERWIEERRLSRKRLEAAVAVVGAVGALRVAQRKEVFRDAQKGKETKQDQTPGWDPNGAPSDIPSLWLQNDQ
ncbi:hypothetical protein FOPE_07761 [Fonsecaea pedrosoi]|nr:hypothetical protein FOPE_07761 [Fonsecaea pedrosoi]